MGADDQTVLGEGRTLVFAYGTLKRGFPNHGLMQEMIHSGDVAFVGRARTAARLPLVCGPNNIPFLLNLPDAGERVDGELYAVSARGLARVDELEGTRRGHYERLPISVSLFVDGGDEEAASAVEAEAYYAHRSYAGDLWKRSGEKGYGAYSETEAEGYVKVSDRPRDITFLKKNPFNLINLIN